MLSLRIESISFTEITDIVMKRSYFLLAMVAVIAFLVYSCQEPGDKAAPSDETPNADREFLDIDFPYDSLNYALGISQGKTFLRHSIIFKKDKFIQGVEDVAAGKENLTDDEVQSLLQRFFEAYKDRMLEVNLARSMKEMDSVSRLEGVVKDQSGLVYRIENEGEGLTPEEDSYLLIEYEGMFMDGTVFEKRGSEKPAVCQLDLVIKGWTIGLQRLKEGGTIHLYIPPELGYEHYGQGPIPPNTALYYRVKLIKVLTKDEYYEHIKGN